MALGLAGPPRVRASEPSGHAELAYEWLTTAEAMPSVPGVLTVTLKTVVSVAAAEVALEAPIGVLIRTADGSTAPGDRAPQPLGDLAASSTRVFRFEVRVDPGAGGIAVFRLAGILADGRRVVETMGVPVGVPGPRPVSRHGAAEYPAATAFPRRP